jgi:hypothetical protein
VIFQLPLDKSPAEIKGEHIMSIFPSTTPIAIDKHDDMKQLNVYVSRV